MSTALTTFDPQVPAFLRDQRFMALSQRMGAGLSTGAPTRISFKGSRYRYIAADGTETLVNENGTNGTTVDLVVLDANEGVSKFYYPNKYDPQAEGEDAAPACFSEDGKAPSARAKSPQSRSCATCPMNAWGSKISEASGAKIKACSDVKKLAVIPVNNLAGDAYMIGIPGASLKTWSGLVASTSKRGVPLSALIVRFGFNPAASYPQLTFTPTSFLNQSQFDALSDLFGSPDLDELVGRGDAPHGGPFALEQPHPGNTVSNVGAAENMRTATGPGFASAHPVGVAPIVPPQGMHLPQHSQQAIAKAAAVPQQPIVVQQPQPEQPPPAARRRGRPPAATQQPPAQVNVAPTPAFLQPAPQAAAPNASVANTPGTSAEMNNLLDSIMKPKG